MPFVAVTVTRILLTAGTGAATSIAREAGRKQTGRGERRRWAVALSMATSAKERGRAGAGNFACSRQGGA